MNVNHLFTNITIGEFVDFNSDNINYWTNEMILPRISDKDPFLTFYYLDGLYKGEKKFTLGEINGLIESGKLETFFTKLK